MIFSSCRLVRSDFFLLVNFWDHIFIPGYDKNVISNQVLSGCDVSRTQNVFRHFDFWDQILGSDFWETCKLLESDYVLSYNKDGIRHQGIRESVVSSH